MNKGVLKCFALWGRKMLRQELLENASLENRHPDKKSLERNTYLWFMRFIIMRFTELKGYLPKHCSYFSLGSSTRSLSALEGSITYLKTIFPKIFNIRAEDYTELLYELHGNNNSYLNRFISEVRDEEICQVEILGWLHQFYLSEEHENIVGVNNGTIFSEHVPAATQLFTPKWIVQYMVDNSLGKLWVESRETSILRHKLQYYIEPAEDSISFEQCQKNPFKYLKPEEIRFLDPACGCGHILVYAFDILFSIYESCGYEQEDISMLILKNNLYGLDIDENAAAIAEVALILKGREKDESFFKKINLEGLSSNVVCVKNSRGLIPYRDILLQGAENQEFAKGQVDNLINVFINGEELGSLIEIKDFDLNFWRDRLQYVEKCSPAAYGEISYNLAHLIRQSSIMAQKYHVVCTNPPYMSKKYMHNNLKKHIKRKYSSYNGDLFSVFMMRNLEYTTSCGYAAFMTPFVWMFIKEYEELRDFIIDNKSIESLIQLEYSAYADAIVAVCTFVIGNHIESRKGQYIRLTDFKGAENQPVKVLEAIRNFSVNYKFSCSLKRFKHIPGHPFAYWISERVISVFSKGERMGEHIDITGSQNITSDNDKYLRRHWEVEKSSIHHRWQPYTKGGDYRKWYGNIEYVVDWCQEAKEFYKTNKTSNLLSESYCFREGITYNGISVRGFSTRVAGKNIYDKGGPTFHLKDENLKYYLLALLNSKVVSTVMQIYNPTMNYQVQDIKNIPVILTDDMALRNRINKLSWECIEISKKDWNFKETSMEFEQHPFISFKKDNCSLQEIFYIWQQYCNSQYYSLKEKEEELNRIFIKLYGLEGEVAPGVSEGDVTVTKADLREDMIGFISYAVGCILGRYEVEGFSTAAYVPFTKENNFKDSLADKFVEFLSFCFGEEKQKENIEFITAALGCRKKEQPLVYINKYFLKGFFKDHCRIFKNRPVYWRFASGETMAFNALIYMNKLDSNLIRALRQNYFEKMLIMLKEGQFNFSKNSLRKQLQTVEELENYRKLLERFEGTDIKLDLDEGVAKNYNKFLELLQKI
jgi:hypothetical protein